MFCISRSLRDLNHIILIWAFLAPGVWAAGSSPSPAVLTLGAAVEQALASNPGLAETRAGAAAMAAVPSQVGTLPDPRLSLNALNLPTDTFDLDQEPMTQMQVGVQQAFPFPGKLGLQRTAAEHRAAAALHGFEERRFNLVRDVRSAWWRLLYLDQALATVARNQILLDQFVEIARTKYRVGQGLQQDVLLAQVERSKLMDTELRLRGARQAQAAYLNALLDRPANSPVQLPSKVDSTLPAVPSAAELLALADKARPQLAARERQVEAARARLKLAKKDYYPDFNLGLAYGYRQGEDAAGEPWPDFASVRLSMNLPLRSGRRQDQAVRQYSSELAQQKSGLDDTRGQVHAQILSALADYGRSRDQVTLFKTGIIPQARQTVASMLAGYQVNKVDFLNLVQTQITLYNYETQYWNALSEANQALAKLAAAVGKETIYE